MNLVHRRFARIFRKKPNELKLSDFQKAVKAMKALPPQEDMRLEIRNIPLFESLKAQGKMKEIEPGVWDYQPDQAA